MTRASNGRFARVRGALAALVATLGMACVSPTLPLPPPAAPTVSVGLTPDTFTLRSIAGAQPNALVIILNRDERLARNKRVTGTLADEQGSWDATVIAKVGDVLDITQEAGSSGSPGTTVIVR